MHVRCPHCHNPIEVVDDSPLSDILCDSCGSDFSLVGDPHKTVARSTELQTIGRFQLTHQLGMGAFGTVWRAQDTELDRKVAIKLPRQGQISGAEAEQFLREARAAAQLKHPNIVCVHEVGRRDDQIYIVSDYVAGMTLAERLTVDPPSPREAVQLCVKVAAALHHAHESGVIHRDLKPANIMLDEQGVPHLTDFGLAKRESGEITMTIEGQLLGTPAYMSPEQAKGDAHDADRRSDVYSLGVILFELLTGELPFRGKQRMLLHQVIHEDPPSPRGLNANIGRDLNTICLKCLEKQPKGRYATAADLEAELNRALAGRPIIARPIGPLERTWRWCKRKPTLAGLCAVAVILLLVLSIGGTLVALQQAYARRADRDAYYAYMLLVQRDWEDANVRHFGEVLNRHRDRDDLKGFEWSYWDRLAHSDLLTIATHDGALHSVAFSPDGTRIASAGATNSVRVWDAVTGDNLLTIEVESTTFTLAFSPDGNQLAVGGAGQMIKVWDAATGQEKQSLEGHAAPVWDVAFSPDGTQLATASWDNTVRVWDMATGQTKLTLDGHQDKVISVEFSPDGTRLASASGDNTVKIWDTTNGEELHTLQEHRDDVTGIAFSPDGALLASASKDNTLNLWDTDSWQFAALKLNRDSHVIFTIEFQPDISFSPDGTRLVSSSPDNTVKVWDVATRQETLTLRGHRNQIYSVAFSPDGRRLASSSGNPWEPTSGEVKVWDAITGQEPLTLARHTSLVRGVAFSPDGKRLASASADKTVRVWDAATGQEINTLQGHTAQVWVVAFSPNGTLLASASADGTVKVWNVASGQEIYTLEGHTGWVVSVAFSPDGKLLASASEGSKDRTVRVWNLNTGQEELLARKEHAHRVRGVAFSPDGRRLASASLDHTVTVWDAATGKGARTLTGHDDVVLAVAFSPDGTRLVSGSQDSTLRVWDSVTGEEKLTLNGHNGPVWCVAFSLDGTRLASASQDRTAKVWDASTGQEAITLKGQAEVWSIAFSPDGNRLAAASGSPEASHPGEIKVWDARPWTPELRAESQARGLLTVQRNRANSLEKLEEDIRSDETISDTVRKQALDWAELFWKQRKREEE